MGISDSDYIVRYLIRHLVLEGEVELTFANI